MKRLSFFVLTVIFWLVACIPTQVPGSPSPTSLPTETSTPAAEESEYVTYQDTKNKFEIIYSTEHFIPDMEDSNDDVLVLVMNLETFFAGKNLKNVTVTISAGPNCRYADIYTETNLTGEEKINDIPFSVYSTRDAGTPSNVFQTLTYQTEHNNLCYEIHLNIREYSLTAFPDVAEYDPEFLIIEFKNLIGTFKFIE